MVLGRDLVLRWKPEVVLPLNERVVKDIEKMVQDMQNTLINSFLIELQVQRDVRSHSSLIK